MTRDSVDREAERIHSSLKEGGDANDTLARYKNLMEEHPSRRPDILSQRAYSWAWLNELERAIGDLREALLSQQGPRLAASLSHLSSLLLGLGQLGEAELVLGRLVALENSEGSTYFTDYAHLARAYCLARLGRSREALEELASVPEDTSVDWLESTPPITCDLVRRLAGPDD